MEARRLRLKLDEYYNGPGKQDPLRIDLPKGSYVPSWDWQFQSQPDTSPEPLRLSPEPKRQRLLPALAAIVILFALTLFFTRNRWLNFFEERGAAATHAKIRSVAILPFRNLPGDPSKEYLADGLTDELTTELAKIQKLKVISRTSADQYRTTHKHLPESHASLTSML